MDCMAALSLKSSAMILTLYPLEENGLLPGKTRKPCIIVSDDAFAESDDGTSDMTDDGCAGSTYPWMRL